MKSVTIKDMNGQKLIKIFHNGKGEYFVERNHKVADCDVLIVLDDRSRITFPLRNK